MSIFFPQFSPLFQLADEIERASRPGNCGPKRHVRSFAPRFDVTETKDSYQLLGELPGLDQSRINIEWAEDNTLTISGSTQKSYESRSTSSISSASPASSTSSASDAGEEPEVIDAEEASGYQKPSVEDDKAETSATNEKDSAVTETETKQEVAKPAEKGPHYWVSERSYGSFSRSFKFPIRVDHDNVKANLRNGILSITIPKAKPLEPRKITIQ